MNEKTIADLAWARALLHRTVVLALLRAAFEYAQAARSLRP